MSSQNGTVELLFSNFKGSETQSNKLSFLGDIMINYAWLSHSKNITMIVL